MAASDSEQVFSEIARLKRLGESWNLTNEQINQCIVKSFTETKVSSNFCKKLWIRFVRTLKFFCLSIFICILLYFLISCHNPTKRFFSRHIQELIYPFMRFLRLITLPFHHLYESSRLYQESCLISNPLYVEPLTDCSPCEGVRFIVNLSGLTNFTRTYYNHGIPFVVKESRNTLISTEILAQFYSQNQFYLDQGTIHFSSNIPEISHPRHLFNADDKLVTQLFHSEWKLNKVPAIRALRKLFLRPNFIPNDTEVALQKILFIDGYQSLPYDFPLTDFANVWLAQVQGSRLLVLEPSEKCRHLCSPLSTVLQPNQILYYNWQYWRPLSVPVNISKELSVTFMGSFY